jgi:hypothetical protein
MLIRTDAWGVDEVTAWVDNGAPMILMCTGDGITTPAAADNGHWLAAICTLDC